MEEQKKYSPWEYEEDPEKVEDPNKDPDNQDPNPDEDPNKNPKDDYSDDTPVKVRIDGQVVEMTAGELAKGYMRQSDYTRKTQELSEKIKNASPEEKKEITAKANDIVENPENFSSEDVNTAKYLLKVIKSTGLSKEFGLMTREDFEAEKAKEKQVAEFSTKLDSAKDKVSKMKGMPPFDEEAVLNHMQETGIHEPYAAYINMNDAQYRNFIIKQSKGDTSYQSDKGGKKIEPIDKPVDVRTEEGHRSFLADEIAKLKDNK